MLNCWRWRTCTQQCVILICGHLNNRHREVKKKLLVLILKLISEAWSWWQVQVCVWLCTAGTVHQGCASPRLGWLLHVCVWLCTAGTMCPWCTSFRLGWLFHVCVWLCAAGTVCQGCASPRLGWRLYVCVWLCTAGTMCPWCTLFRLEGSNTRAHVDRFQKLGICQCWEQNPRYWVGFHLGNNFVPFCVSFSIPNFYRNTFKAMHKKKTILLYFSSLHLKMYSWYRFCSSQSGDRCVNSITGIKIKWHRAWRILLHADC